MSSSEMVKTQTSSVARAPAIAFRMAALQSGPGLKKDSVPYSWKDFEAVRLQIGNLLKSAK